MTATVRYFSTAGAGSEDGTSWANRAPLFNGSNQWSSVITGHDFSTSGLVCRVGPGSYTCGQTLQNSLFTTAPTGDFPLVIEAADSSGDQLAVPDPAWVSSQPVWDDTDMPVITFDTIASLTLNTEQDFYIFRLLKFVSAVAPSANAGSLQSGYWDWCFLVISWSQASGYGFQDDRCWPTNCCVHHTGSNGNGVGYQPSQVKNVRCVSSGTGGAGFKTSESSYQVFAHCTAIGWSYGFLFNQASDGWQRLVWRCLAANATNSGFYQDRTNTPIQLSRYANCAAVNNGGYGIKADSTGATALVENGYFKDNTSGSMSLTGDLPTDLDNITGSDGDFVDEDAASNFDKDYRFSKTGPYAGYPIGPGWEI